MGDSGHCFRRVGCYSEVNSFAKVEKANDQIDRFCCLSASRHNAGTGNDSCACSRAGRHDHASRLRMRAGQDTSSWCLRGQNHHSPGSQVRAMEWRLLRPVAQLLRRLGATSADRQACSPTLLALLRGPSHIRTIAIGSASQNISGDTACVGGATTSDNSTFAGAATPRPR